MKVQKTKLYDNKVLELISVLRSRGVLNISECSRALSIRRSSLQSLLLSLSRRNSQKHVKSKSSSKLRSLRNGKHEYVNLILGYIDKSFTVRQMWTDFVEDVKEHATISKTTFFNEVIKRSRFNFKRVKYT
jgi:hypothetical protein